MPDWIENALYVLAGGMVGLLASALACAARRADAEAERRGHERKIEMQKLREMRARYTGEPLQ